MKILLGCYFNHNMGDDIMIKIICDRYPQHKFYIVTQNDCDFDISNVSNLTLLKIIPSNWNLFKKTINYFLKKLGFQEYQYIKLMKTNDFDCYVLIGGSLFIEIGDWKSRITSYEYIIERVNHSEIIGCNFGPYTTKEFFSRHKQLFNKVDLVSFRERYSYNLFKEIDNKSFGSDIVFNIDSTSSTLSLPYIIISVIGIDTRADLKEYYDYYKNFLISMIEILSADYKIVIFSACPNQGDEVMSHKLKADLPNEPNIDEVSYSTVDKAVELFSNCKAVIGSRFHSCILAIKYNKPILPLIYSNKTSNELDDLNYKGYRLNISDLTKAKVEDYTDFIDKNILYDQSITTTSQVHFKLLDEYLK